MILLSTLRPHPFACYNQLVDAIKLKAPSLFGTKSILCMEVEREGHIGHLLDLTNPGNPILYSLWGHWPSDHEKFCLNYLAYGQNSIDDFFSLYSSMPDFVRVLASVGFDVNNLRNLLCAHQSEIAHIVLMPEVRQDFLLDIQQRIPSFSFMRFSRMIDRKGDTIYLFDSLYSFFQLETEMMESTICSERRAWEERSLSDTIVLSLSEERFFKEYIGERIICEIPILPGSKSRLRYVAIKRNERDDKPLYISRISSIEGEIEGHGHRLYLAPKIFTLEVESKTPIGLVPSYAKALTRKVC